MGEMSSEQLSGMFRRKELEEQAGTTPAGETPTSHYHSRWDIPEQTEAMKAGLASEQPSTVRYMRPTLGVGRGCSRDRPGAMDPSGSGGMRDTAGMRGTSGRRGTRRGTGSSVSRPRNVNPTNPNESDSAHPQFAQKQRETGPRGVVRGRGTTGRPGYHPGTTYIGYNKDLVRAKTANTVGQSDKKPDQAVVDARLDGKPGMTGGEKGVKGVKGVQESEKGPVRMSVLNKEREEVVHVLDDSDPVKENELKFKPDVCENVVMTDYACTQKKEKVKYDKASAKNQTDTKTCDTVTVTVTVDREGSGGAVRPRPTQIKDSSGSQNAISGTPRSLIQSRLAMTDWEESMQGKEDERPKGQAPAGEKTTHVDGRQNAIAVNLSQQINQASELLPAVDNSGPVDSHAVVEPRTTQKKPKQQDRLSQGQGRAYKNDRESC